MEMNAHYKDFTDELASLIDPQDYFQPPPSSYHFASNNSRQTPSPQQQQQQQQQYHHALASRSRSRSRPPSASESASAGSIGPARRSRRNNSVSSTSPPPYARPHAIVIPATRPGNGSGWFTQSSCVFSYSSLESRSYSTAHPTFPWPLRPPKWVPTPTRRSLTLHFRFQINHKNKILSIFLCITRAPLLPLLTPTRRPHPCP
jgi:hypothetical protein